MKKPLEDVQAAVFKALGHPTRTRIVSILARDRGKCVCDLVDQLGYDQSTVSKHLAVLKTVGILKSTKQGLNVIYEIGMPCVAQFLKCVECVATSDAEEPQCGSCKMCGTGEPSPVGGH
ncbi:MAG: metalloregulator ArsR/SmtB family transcription factor [Bacillota bacterium]